MKKLTIILSAVVMGFIMTSCGDSTKDGIIKDVDKYFTDAEKELGTVDNVADFLTFAEVMNDRSDLLELLDEKYGKKTLSDEDNEAVQNFIYDRATAYNTAEALKCGEFLAPIVDQFETTTNELHNQFKAGEPFDDEAVYLFVDAYQAVADFQECQNVPKQIQDRLGVIQDQIHEMDSVLALKISVLLPAEEE